MLRYIMAFESVWYKSIGRYKNVADRESIGNEECIKSYRLICK